MFFLFFFNNNVLAFVFQIRVMVYWISIVIYGWYIVVLDIVVRFTCTALYCKVSNIMTSIVGGNLIKILKKLHYLDGI